ncbi:MAG: glutamate formimidoyltransferase [Solirubrobacterales bacterium]
MRLAVPNVSEGRDPARVDDIVKAFQDPAALLDFHFDAVHNRTVVTLASTDDALADSLLAGGREAVGLVDIAAHEGAHPCIGALDVCPVVFIEEGDREPARAEALAIAERLAGELSLPVFLYGDLASSEQRRERAYFRDGGITRLGERMASGELAPDFGPPTPHPSAGATLVTARPPLAAFNLFLDSPDPGLARLVAAALRESAGGLPGVRAIGLPFEGVTQVSTNIHDPLRISLADVVTEVRRLAEPLGARATSAEIVGLVPKASLRGFPESVELIDPDVDAHVLERRLEKLGR